MNKKKRITDLLGQKDFGNEGIGTLGDNIKLRAFGRSELNSDLSM
jgi:hypothetical protein